MLMKIRRADLADWIRRDITQLDKRFGVNGVPDLRAKLREFIERAEVAATDDDDNPAYRVAHDWEVWRRRQRYERRAAFLIFTRPVFRYRDLTVQIIRPQPDPEPLPPGLRQIVRRGPRRRSRG